MITAIALDDEPPALEIIKDFCSRLDNIELVRTFTSTSDALDYIESQPVDLLFLDINMPSVTGIDFVKKLSRQPMVIFITSYSEYAVESYELNALDYLVKPFTFKRFSQSVNKAKESLKLKQQALTQDQQYLLVRAEYSLVNIPLSDIEYIEGLDNYLRIHLTAKAPVVVRMTMKNVQEKLSPAFFVRVHRSYIIPLAKITAVRNKVIYLSSGVEIPLGNNYEAAFMDTFRQR